MVCPWMEGGTLRDHLISEREALTLDDRFRLVSVLYYCLTRV